MTMSSGILGCDIRCVSTCLQDIRSSMRRDHKTQLHLGRSSSRMLRVMFENEGRGAGLSGPLSWRGVGSGNRPNARLPIALAPAGTRRYGPVCGDMTD